MIGPGSFMPLFFVGRLNDIDDGFPRLDLYAP
jgi:hypothetical protein